MRELDEMLKEPEGAGLAGLAANTFRKYRQLGLGPAYIRISARCIRYRRSDILSWIESRRVKPAHEVSDAQ
jgi:predicted DNA-binding transcriptional regulator AlpA